MSHSRRTFLEAAAGSLALGPAFSRAAADPPRPRVAALATTYHYLSHAYHIVGRFLDGFPLHDGPAGALHRPGFELASLYIEQTPEATDLGRAKARRHGVRLSPSIADALTLGTRSLAVDAVLLIAEHGDYPLNARLQKLYPRGKYFRDVLDVFSTSKRSVPVFIDKHLSYDRREAAAMVASARDQNAPLMAGSSLPVTWRLPEVEIPLGQAVSGAVVASRGELEVFGFHALETLQCMVERRGRDRKPQGVKAVRCLEGEAVWNAIDAGAIPAGLLGEALARSHSVNVGDMRQNVRDFGPPSARPTFLRGPIAFQLDYADGLSASILILNGHVDDTTVACRLGAPKPGVVSTLMYLPAPPGASFFNPLVLRIEEFFRTGKPPYPVERTLLTGGVLDAACESRAQGHDWVATPELATIDYDPPADSGFIRTPLARP